MFAKFNYLSIRIKSLSLVLFLVGIFVLPGYARSISLESSDTPITNYVVALDGSGDYSSIQSAIDAAVSKTGKTTIWIKNGSYYENLVLHDQINLVGASGLGDLGDVEITGVHTPPLSGHIILRNIRWNGDHYILYSIKPGTAHITFMDALLNVRNGYSCYLPYWDGVNGGTLEFDDINPGLSDQSSDGAVYNPYGGAQVFLYNAGLGMGKSNTMVVSGRMVMLAASISCPIQFNSGSVLDCNSSIIEEGIKFEGNSTAEISNSKISCFSTPVIEMNSTADVRLSACVLEGLGKPVIDGSGQGSILVSGCTFPLEAEISATVNQHNVGIVKAGSLEISSEKIQILGGDGPPTVRASKGSLYLRSDGSSSNSRVYINIDNGYTWTPLVTEN